MNTNLRDLLFGFWNNLTAMVSMVVGCEGVVVCAILGAMVKNIGSQLLDANDS